MNKATPRPWYIEWSEDGTTIEIVRVKFPGDVLVELAAEEPRDGANAALIVAAVNAHDKAKKLARFAIEYLGPARECGPESLELRDLAREFLRLAGEEE